MTERFTDNQNGTLTDTRLGLMWQESYAYAESGNYFSWYEANKYIQKLNQEQLGGHDDWRLPDRLELVSLYEVGKTFEWRGRTFELHIDPSFEFGYGSQFWTWRERLSGAVCFGFDHGDVRWYPKASPSATVRAVRRHLNPFKLLEFFKEGAHA